MAKESKFFKVICSKCGILNLVPVPLASDEPVKCEKCGKVLVVRE